VTVDDVGFAGRYGPWALVAGASEGVGAAYARAMAERGLNVVLLARRHAVLDEVAAAIRAATGVEARTVAVDLTAPDAMARTVEATAGLDVGMVMYNAGADPHYEPFLANPVGLALAMTQRNCVVPLQMCHHFGAAMVMRGRGGMVVVSSGAGLVGAANMVAYGATKAFDIVMAEGLWAELQGTGVDVLSLVLGATDTPAFRRMLVKRGVLASVDDEMPLPGVATVDDVVAEAIANLANGPTWFAGEQVREGAQRLSALPRGEAVRMMLDRVSVMDARDDSEAPA
jgi:short-subunit dehydrogenase